MSPVIENSVVKIAPNQWLIGSSMICEMDLAAPPEAVAASWTNDSGRIFYLRMLLNSSECPREDVEELSQIDRVHQAGTSAAVWSFGGVHIKAKAWIPELQSENDTIEHVRKTKIPVPEVVFSWVDRKWNRSFLFLKSIPGRTLYQAWPDLSQSHKHKIAGQIASYCAELATSTALRMETLSGKGVQEDFLFKRAPFESPSWKPVVEGPFTADQLKSYLQDPSIAFGSEFHFYHADLGPTNIILDDNEKIAAVIDWESAAFHPRFWIATKPLYSAGFNLGVDDRSDWAFLLSRTLEAGGFKADEDVYKRWRVAVKE